MTASTKKALWLVSSMVVVAVAAAALFFLWSSQQNPPPAPDTETVLGVEELPPFDEQLGATGNLTLFTAVITEAHAEHGVDADSAVAALHDTGFSAWKITHTQTETTIGIDPNAIQIAVLDPNGECLVGHLGSDGQATAIVAAAVQGKNGETCLLGQ